MGSPGRDARIFGDRGMQKLGLPEFGEKPADSIFVEQTSGKTSNVEPQKERTVDVCPLVSCIPPILPIPEFIPRQAPLKRVRDRTGCDQFPPAAAGNFSLTSASGKSQPAPASSTDTRFTTLCGFARRYFSTLSLARQVSVRETGSVPPLTAQLGGFSAAAQRCV